MTNWKNLVDAYGSAATVPQLLGELSPDSDQVTLDELWSRLCHQGTVYSASFAALPVLADISQRWNPTQRAGIIALAAVILASKEHCPPEMVGSLEQLVLRFQEQCRESLSQSGLPKSDFIFLLQAVRSLDGDRFWGEQLDHLTSGEFSGACPSCGIDQYLVIGEFGFFTSTEEWVEHSGDNSGRVAVRRDIKTQPIQPSRVALPPVGRLLHESAEAAGQTEVATWIRHLFGTSRCPACDQPFVVQDAINAS